jgi:hypothetical protein
MIYEYWVVPAPRKGEKARGLKSSEERFAYALTTLLTDMGAQGWEYQRADALPCDERSGLTGTKTTFHNVLVFRRALEQRDDQRESKKAAGQTMAFAASAPAAPSLGAAVQPLGSAPALGPATSDD